MRIGIMGDTHGNLTILRKVVEIAGAVDAWIHTGDYSQDARTLEQITNLPVYAVCGNCDMYEGRAPLEKLVNLAGHAIWITHGNRYLHGYGEDTLVARGQEQKADIVVYGHTHVPVIKWHDNILVINPGSPARPRMGTPTYGILTMTGENKPKAEIFEVREKFL